MVRCVEYYEKCERDGYDWCDKEPETVRVIKEYIQFYKKLEEMGVPKETTIVGLPEFAIRPLIRERDEQVRENAIIKCRDRLIGKTGAGRGNTKNLTEKDIKKIIEDAEIEIRNETIRELDAEEEASPIKNITQEEVDKLLGLPEDPGPLPDPKPVINDQGNIVYSEAEVEKIKSETGPYVTIKTIMQFEINLYFEVMQKIGCEEDSKKHKKRMDMMIQNKTLLVVG